MTKELDWIQTEPEFIGAYDECETFFARLVEAARAGVGMWDEDADAIAKMAYKLQLESILWIYHNNDEEYITDFGLPKREDAAKRFNFDSYEYDSPEAREFAEWVMENQEEDWREQRYARSLERQLERVKNGLR